MEVSAQIAEWVNKGRQSQRDSLQYLLLAGQALRDQKASLKAGEWLLWLKAHESELGFGIRTAQYLMRAALNAKLPSHLDDDQVSAICANIWRKDADVEPHEAPKVFGAIERLLAFTRKHSPSELLSVQERTQLAAYLAQLRTWLSEAESLFERAA